MTRPWLSVNLAAMAICPFSLMNLPTALAGTGVKLSTPAMMKLTAAAVGVIEVIAISSV